MILCVDIGNTAIKLARVSGRRVHDLTVVRSDASAAQMARAVARVSGNGFDAAAISSVRPKTTIVMRDTIRRDLGVEPLVVSSRAKLPIKIATRHPARVGVDRICAACGALPGSARHAIIIDAGSAITVDLVIDRRFLGGLIMAGPQMSLSALHDFTAQLPDLKLSDVPGERFNDTRSAMLTGATTGAAGAIEAAVRLLQRRTDQRGVPVWLTGGYASRLERRLPKSYKSFSGLTLVGLARIARHA